MKCFEQSYGQSTALCISPCIFTFISIQTLPIIHYSELRFDEKKSEFPWISTDLIGLIKPLLNTPICETIQVKLKYETEPNDLSADDQPTYTSTHARILLSKNSI